MKPDSMTIVPEMIVKAHVKIAKAESNEAFEELKQREPVLGSWIEQEMLSLAGKMGLSGTSHQVLVGSYNDFESILLTALEAVRSGHYALWRDSLSGTPLEATLWEETESESDEAPSSSEEHDSRDEVNSTE